MQKNRILLLGATGTVIFLGFVASLFSMLGVARSTWADMRVVTETGIGCRAPRL